MSSPAARPRLSASSAGLLLSGLALLFPNSSTAVTRSWSSAIDGSWRDAARWSPVGVPTSTDTVRLQIPGAYTVVLQGSVTVAHLSVGGTGSAPTLWIQGSATRGSALLRVSGSATNAGRIRLESVGATSGATLQLDAGVLVNEGTVETGVGGGGPRSLSLDLDNRGQLRVGATTVLTKAAGVYANTGSVWVDAGQTLTITGSAQAFTQQAGTLRIDGSLTFLGNTASLGSSSFAYLGGTIAGELTVQNAVLTLGSGGTGAADFRVRDRTEPRGKMSADQPVWINGTTLTSAVATWTSGLINEGTIRLESSEAPEPSLLVVPAGLLTNRGRIEVARGSGGYRRLTAVVENRGTVAVGSPVTWVMADTTTTSANYGEISVFAGDTLVVNGGTLANHEPGTVGGGGLLLLDGTTFTGTGILQADLEMRGSTLSPGGAAAGVLTVEGAYHQDARSRVDLDLNGARPGTEHDLLAITGPAALGGGRLGLRIGPQYRPAACDGFTVLTAQDLTGAFQQVQTVGLSAELRLLPDQDPRSLALLVRAPASRVNLSTTELAMTEGGQDRAYRVCLAQPPLAETVVTPEPDGQLLVSSGALVFPVGVWERVDTVAVTAVDDGIAEGSHQGAIQHRTQSADPDFDRLLVPSIAARIEDRGAAPGLTVEDLLLSEGDSGVSQAGFTVRLSAASSEAVTVAFRTANGTAIAGSDYTATSGILTLAPGQTVAVLPVEIIGDRIHEPDEAFSVELDSAAHAVIVRGQGAAHLANDDPLPTLSIADAEIPEGSAGNRSLVFAVTLSAPSATPISVTWATADGTAMAGSDYPAASGILTFPPGTTSRSLGITVSGDQTAEPDEHLTLRLTDPAGAALARGEGTGVILNDDLAVLSVGDATVAEGNEGTRGLLFPVSLSTPSAAAVSVAWTTVDGTAIAGTDYTAASGRLTLSPGETTSGDLLYELNESLVLRLSDPTGAGLADSIGLGFIINDDPLPSLSIADASVIEGQTGTNSLVFTVTLSTASGQAVTATWATANGTAVAGTDYAATGGTVTLAAGTTTATVAVPVHGDVTNEADETLALTLSNPAGAVLARSQAAGTITNDDGAPLLSIGDAILPEGNSGSRLISFIVSLTNPSTQAITVSWVTRDSTATAGSDYLAASGVLTFPPGTTARTLTVPVQGDLTVEPPERLIVDLRDPVGAAIADGHGLGTILNDDTARLSITDPAVEEGNSGTRALTFRVSLSNPSLQTASATWTTADGTALAGSDYVTAGDAVVFAPGQTAQDLTVLINGDDQSEVNETMTVRLDAAANAVIADSAGTGTILNDDLAAGLSVGDLAAAEGSSGPRNMTFVVSLSPVSGQPVTVSWTTAAVSAAAGTDFVPAGGALSFAPGETSKTVSVAVIGDTLNEADETFAVNLSTASGAAIADRQGLGTLVNDDPLPGLSVGDVTLAEGDTGTTALVFPVSLSTPSGRPVTVTCGTVNGTAGSGGDYTPISRSLAIGPGQATVNVVVPVIGERLNESDETLFLRLDSPSNATLADAQGIGTLLNDDPLPGLSVGDVAVDEGSTGTRGMNFTLNLSASSGRTVWVTWTTADGTAQAGSDYTAASGLLSLAAGQTSKTVSVTIHADSVYEAGETLALNLDAPVHAILVRAQGLGTIRNDDPRPLLSIGDASAQEGDSGTGQVSFPVTLSRPSGLPVSAAWTTADGTALAGSDYAAVSGTFTLAPGDTVTSLRVAIHDDAAIEATESFTVNLLDPVNASIARGQAVGTIDDDDSLPRIAVADAAAAEGSAGPNALAFTLTLSAPSTVPVTVAWATADGSALAGSDYTAASGSLSFAVGETAKPVAVTINGDALNEVDESFYLNLSSPTKAIIADAQGVGAILNDDPLPSMSIDDVTVVEGNSGTGTLGFTVSLSAASGQTVTVGYATADISAAAGSDYVAQSGTVSLAPGQTSATVAVTVNGDLIIEPNEVLALNLSNPVKATLADAQGLGTLTNDDAIPTISVNDPSATEGNSGTHALTFTVSLSNPTAQTVTVHYATANGTASSSSDYTSRSGSLSFAAGETTKPVAVTIKGDLPNEADETLYLNLTNPTNATIADAQGIGTILNDDPLPTLAISDKATAEGNSGTKSLTFTLTLSAASGRTVTVAWATANGTATAGTDYTAGSGTTSFSAGVTTRTASVTIKGDRTSEPNEVFYINLSNPTNATIADAQGIGTITNDDGAAKTAVGQLDPATFGAASYPNPFNPATEIVYALPEDAPVRLAVYDVLGQQVRLLVDQIQAGGIYRVGWDGRDKAGQALAAGLYLFRLQAGPQVALGKMILAP
ncbi:MAG: Calx-beta domain-containing protein [Candidatus Latescibacterota bacterium]|jgi:hypothetical protein